MSAHTPVGLTAVQTGFLSRAGAVGLRESPLPGPDGKPFTMGLIPTISSAIQGAERLEALATPPLIDLLAELQPRLTGMRLRIHLLVDEGISAARVGSGNVLDQALRQQARTLHDSDVPVEIHGLGTGGGAAVLQTISQQLQQQVCDAVIFGGVHSDCDPERVDALGRGARIYSSDNRDGMVPGEGAAFVLLMRPETARAYRLPVRSRIRGFAAGFEDARPDNDDSAFEAKGLTVAVRQALSFADGQKVGWLMNDLGFELFRLYEYQAVLARTQHLMCPPQVMDAPSQRFGDQGAASLPLHLAMATEAWRRGYAPYPLLLTTTGSDSGARTAVLVAEEK